MRLREQIIFNAKARVNIRINNSINYISPYVQARAEDGELLRQLRHPDFYGYDIPIINGMRLKGPLPTSEDTIEFLKLKRKELWQ